MGCPYCKGRSGYYDKNIQSYQQNYTWDGEPDDATEVRHVKGGKRRYCIDCDRDITAHTQF